MKRSIASDPRVGTELAGYRIEALLGRGGMSVVYLAEDRALGRKVALKLLAEALSGDARFRERFRLESRLAASIDHPNVIPIYDAGEADGELFIAMRYVEGTDLRHVLERDGALDCDRAVDLVAQVAEGLEAAHTRGLVHRDVKPSNVLIARQGEREHAYLADFGLTRTAVPPEEDASTAPLSGTTDYAAPEQITEGAATVAADIYSLGCVLFESLTGRVPYPRPSEFETLWAHVDEPAPRASELRPDLPPALERVVARAMAKDPRERFTSGTELAAAARAALPVPRRFGRTAVGVAATAAALATAAVLAFVLGNGGDQARSPTAPTTTLTSGALQRVDTQEMRLDATIEVGGEPIDVAAVSGGLWLVSGAGPSFQRVDPETNAVTRGPALPGIESAIATRRDRVWIASHGSEAEALLVELDPRRRSAGTKIELPQPTSRAGGRARVPFRSIGAVVADPEAEGPGFAGWLVDAAQGSLLELRPGAPGGGAVSIPTGGTPLDLAVQGDVLWAVQAGEVVELSVGRRSGRARVESRARIAGTPIAVAADERGAWVATREGRILRVLTGGRVPISLEVNEGLPDFVNQGRPVDIALGAGSLWLLLSDGTLERLDPRTAESQGTVDVGSNPVGLTVAEDTVWVAARGGKPLGNFPRRYAIAQTGPPPPSKCPPGRTTCLQVFGIELEARDGTSALLEAALLERRVPGGSVRCLGRRYRGPATIDERDAGAGRMRVARWGIVVLRFERLRGAAETAEVAAGPPLCGEGTGRWVGTMGAVKGATGRFTLTALPRERLVLR